MFKADNLIVVGAVIFFSFPITFVVVLIWPEFFWYLVGQMAIGTLLLALGIKFSPIARCQKCGSINLVISKSRVFDEARNIVHGGFDGVETTTTSCLDCGNAIEYSEKIVFHDEWQSGVND